MNLYDMAKELGKTDKWKYAKYYDFLLSDTRRILEIGVSTGQSLSLWATVLPKVNDVIGIDNNPNFFKHCTLSLSRVGVGPTWKADYLDNVTVYYPLDAYSKEAIDVLNRNYVVPDVIIDDGPHTWESWCFFLANYVGLMKKGGMAIIEDIKREDIGMVVNYGVEVCNLDRSYFHPVDYVIGRFETSEALLIYKES